MTSAPWSNIVLSFKYGMKVSAGKVILTYWSIGLSTRALKLDSLDTDPRSGFNVVSRELNTARRLRALYCWTRSQALFRSTVKQKSTQLGSGSRTCRGKVVIESASWEPRCHAAQQAARLRIEAVRRQCSLLIRISDWVRVQGPVWMAPITQ